MTVRKKKTTRKKVVKRIFRGSTKNAVRKNASVKRARKVVARKRNRQDIHQIVRDHIRAGRNQKQILDLMKRAGFKKEYLAEARKIYNSEKLLVKRMRTGRNPKQKDFSLVTWQEEFARKWNRIDSKSGRRLARASAERMLAKRGYKDAHLVVQDAIDIANLNWRAERSKKNPKAGKVLSTVKRVAVKAGKTAIGAVKGAIKGGVKAAKGNPDRLKLHYKRGDKIKDVFGKWHEVFDERGNLVRVLDGSEYVHKSKIIDVKKVSKKPARKAKNAGFQFTPLSDLTTDADRKAKYKATIKEIRSAETLKKKAYSEYLAADRMIDAEWKRVPSGGKPPQSKIDEYENALKRSEDANSYVQKLDDYGSRLEASLGRKNPARGTRKRGGRRQVVKPQLPKVYPVNRHKKKGGKRPVVSRGLSAQRRKRNSPIAERQRKQFAGHFDGYRDLYYPSTNPPKEPSKLGELKSIRTSKADFNPIKGSMWLCRDSAGKLHIGTTRQGEMFAGPVQDLGVVERIEYLERKPHLGDYQLTEYYHRMGEENGIKPHLWSDGRGGLVFRGGDYRIESRGIVN